MNNHLTKNDYLKRMEEILSKEKGVILRGYEGTNKFGIAMLYLAKVFNSKATETSQIIKEIENYNLKNITSKYIEKNKIEDIESRRKRIILRRSRIRGEDLSEEDIKAMAKEYMNEMPAIWTVIESLSDEEINEFELISSINPNLQIYVITNNVRIYANLNYLFKYRDTPFEVDSSYNKRLSLGSNVNIIIIADGNYSLRRTYEELLQIISNIEIKPDKNVFKDPKKAELMFFVNDLLTQENIFKFDDGLGEDYFNREIPIDQIISNLEPIIYSKLYIKLRDAHGKVETLSYLKEFFENIMDKIRNKFLTK